MTFGKGKQINVIDLGKRGAYKRNKLFGNPLNKLWENPEWKKQALKRSSEQIKKFNESLTKEQLSKHRSEAGKKSRLYENTVGERIKSKFEQLFLPSVVCDRIGIKNGKLIFIEIKKAKTEKLKPNQEKFRKICNQMEIEYIIEYF